VVLTVGNSKVAIKKESSRDAKFKPKFYPRLSFCAATSRSQWT